MYQMIILSNNRSLRGKANCESDVIMLVKTYLTLNIKLKDVYTYLRYYFIGKFIIIFKQSLG